MTDAAHAPRTIRPFAAMMAANTISGIGSRVTSIAIPWFVLETTGSATRVGVVAFFTLIPAIFSSVLGGALADRFDPRRVSVIGDLLSALFVCLIPLLYATTGLSFWMLCVLGFLITTADMPGATARLALVRPLSERAEMPLERANGVSQALQAGSSLAGPVVGGLLIALFGTTKVLWIDGVSFLVSALLIWLMVPATPRTGQAQAGYLADLRVGLAYVRADTLLVSMLAVGALTNMALSPFFAVLMPIFAKEIWHSPRALGIVLGGGGVGAIAGALLFGVIGRSVSRRLFVLLLFAMFAAAVFGYAAQPGVPVAIGLAFLMGFAGGALDPLMITTIQQRVPADLHGRVFGLVLAFSVIAAPIGVLLAGVGIAVLGLTGVVLVIAVVLLVATAGIALLPAMRELSTAEFTVLGDERSSAA